MSKVDTETLRIKKDIIKHLQRNVFYFHNRCNVSKYVREMVSDSNHNNDGVAKDVCDKLKATGEFEIFSETGSTDLLAVKIKNTSFREKYWWVLLLLGWVIGVWTDIGKEWLKEKILPEKTAQQPTTQASTDIYD